MGLTCEQLGPKRYMVPVQDADTKEWKWLMCSEKLYKELNEKADELKKKLNTCREPIVVIKEPNGTTTAVLGQT